MNATPGPIPAALARLLARAAILAALTLLPTACNKTAAPPEDAPPPSETTADAPSRTIDAPSEPRQEAQEAQDDSAGGEGSAEGAKGQGLIPQDDPSPPMNADAPPAGLSGDVPSQAAPQEQLGVDPKNKVKPTSSGDKLDNYREEFGVE